LSVDKVNKFSLTDMENTTKGLGAEQQQQLLFMMLIQQHEQIAGMGLGRIPNPVTNKTEMDLQSAKYAIDTLMMLQAFTKGNISTDMNEFLEQTLTRLRIDYARAVSDAKWKTGDTRKPDAGNSGGSSGTDEDRAAHPGARTAGTDEEGTAQPDTGKAGDTGKTDPS
jgi:hypothetical protein